MDAQQQRGHQALPARSAGITELPVTCPPSSRLLQACDSPSPSQKFPHPSGIPPHPPLLLQPPLPPQGFVLQPGIPPSTPVTSCPVHPGPSPRFPLARISGFVLAPGAAGVPRVPPALSPPCPPGSPLTFAASRCRPLPAPAAPPLGPAPARCHWLSRSPAPLPLAVAADSSLVLLPSASCTGFRVAPRPGRGRGSWRVSIGERARQSYGKYPMKMQNESGWARLP